MKIFLNEFKWFLNSRLYCSILLLIGVCTYGFVITHYSIGIDDTAISLYFDDGLAPYMGRWTLYVINKLIPLTQMSSFFIELISMIIMLFSATSWCVLFKEMCGDKVEFPAWMYALFAGVFITPICPHSLNKRSLVLSANDKITIEIGKSKEFMDDYVIVNVDGSNVMELTTGGKLLIQCYEGETKIIKLTKGSFYNRLRDKLNRGM